MAKASVGIAMLGMMRKAAPNTTKGSGSKGQKRGGQQEFDSLMVQKKKSDLLSNVV